MKSTIVNLNRITRLHFISKGPKFINLKPSCINYRYFSDSPIRDYLVDVKVPTEGFQLVLHRAANIVLNIAEGLTTKVLHIHSETNLIDYFGTVSNSL